jgi:aminoglycoside phosphotransferase (APT) family kinase protein
MDTISRLTEWFASRMPDGTDVRIDGLGRVDFGHSSETTILTIKWTEGGVDRSRDVVIRARPQEPGLLEPYDLGRQFKVLSALETTRVRAPRPLWLESSGEVIGREFYVMERLPGTVYERGIPDDLAADTNRIERMCESFVEQLAVIHTVDLRSSGLDMISDGDGYLSGEIAHWSSEIGRVQRAPLPALERLAQALSDRQPEQCPTVTLVHGDAKPGNFAFEGSEVSAVFDWELATIGDPLTDIGWAEILWVMPGSFTSRPGAPSPDGFVGRWEELTGIPAVNRPWYRAFNGFKMAVILLVGGHLFDTANSDDWRFYEMTGAIHPLTQTALHDLGVDECPETGPVRPRQERVVQVQQAYKA